MYRYEELNSSCPYAMPEELEFIRQEALKLSQDQRLVMLGCGPGVMAVSALEAHPHPPLASIVDLDTFYYCEAHLRGAGVDLTRVAFLTGDSSKIGELWDIPIDFLIVDGDHTYSGVKKDIRAWWGTVKVGGTIFFHDALERDGGFNGSGEWEFGDVYRAIEDSKDSSWEFVKHVGISLVYRKV